MPISELGTSYPHRNKYVNPLFTNGLYDLFKNLSQPLDSA